MCRRIAANHSQSSEIGDHDRRGRRHAGRGSTDSKARFNRLEKPRAGVSQSSRSGRPHTRRCRQTERWTRRRAQRLRPHRRRPPAHRSRSAWAPAGPSARPNARKTPRLDRPSWPAAMPPSLPWAKRMSPVPAICRSWEATSPARTSCWPRPATCTFLARRRLRPNHQPTRTAAGRSASACPIAAAVAGMMPRIRG